MYEFLIISAGIICSQEVTIQRDLAAGDVWRLQKQIRNTRDVLMALTKHNKKFLYLRDKTLPELREKLKRNQEKIKAEFSYLTRAAMRFDSVTSWRFACAGHVKTVD
jgi:flagellar biosynthesis chaperone FliJ